MVSIGGITEGSLNGAGAYKTLASNAVCAVAISTPLSAVLIWQYGLIGALTSIFLHRFLIGFFNSISMHRIGLITLKKHKERIFDRSILHSFTSTSLPSLLGALMVAPVIAVSMRMLLNHEDGLKELAYFSWVYQIYLIAVFVPSSLGNYFLSKFSRTTGTHRLLNMLIPYLAFSACVVALLFLTKPYILSLAGSPYTSGSSNIFNILIPVVILYSANSIFASYWPSKGRAWFGFFMNLLWAGSMLIITSLTANTRGGEAIAIAFLISYTILFIAQSIAAKLVSHAPRHNESE